MKNSLIKKLIAVSLAFATLIFAGCSKDEPVNEEKSSENISQNVEKKENHQVTEKIVVPHPLRYFASASNSLVWVGNIETDWISTLKEHDINFVEEIYVTEDGCGHIITANASENYDAIVDTYAVYEDGETIYIELVNQSATLENYEVCEINGDTTGKEIVLDYGYSTVIWNFEYRTPNFLFSSEIDLGYSSVLNENYEIIIDNIYTGYQTKVDCSKNESAKNFFHENGKPVMLSGVDFDNYYYDEFTAEDIDGDGDCELIIKSDVCYPDFDNCIGSIVTTIDYNKEIHGFVIVDTKFVEAKKR